MINKIHPYKKLNYSFISSEGNKQNERERLKKYFFHEGENSKNKSSNNSIFNDNISITSQNISKKENRTPLIIKPDETFSNDEKSEKTHLNCNLNLFEQQRDSNINDDYYNISSDRTFNEDGINQQSIFNQNCQSNINEKQKPELADKIKNLFHTENTSNITSIDVFTEEHPCKKMKFFNSDTKFLFVKDIEEKNQKLKRISLEKFLNLDNLSLYKIFLFLSEDMRNTLFLCPKIGEKLKAMLHYKFSYIIEKFKKIYNDYLEFRNYNIINEYTLIKSGIHITFNLVLKFRIRPKSNNIFKKRKNYSYQISYCFSGNTNKTSSIEIFSFDVFEDKSYPLWMSFELEEFKNKLKRSLCLPSINRFSFGDSVIVKINLFQGSSITEDVKWNPIKIVPLSSDEFYMNGKYLSNEVEYDPNRSCDIEKIIRIWHKENEYTKNNKTLKSIIRLMEKNFKIQKIYYDCVRYAYFKVEMIAERKGVIENNNLMNCKIEVIEHDGEIENECVSLACLNKLSNNNSIFKIRRKMKIILYFTDIK